MACKGYQVLLRRNRIRHETSAPYSPHQNGTAERNWRTLFDMARCMLLESQLTKELWLYAVQTAAVVRNRFFNNRTRQTPYFMLTGRRPNVSRMQTFGTVWYAYRQDRKELDSLRDNNTFTPPYLRARKQWGVDGCILSKAMLMDLISIRPAMSRRGTVRRWV